MSENYDSVVLGSGWLYAAPVTSIANVFSLTTTEEAALVNIGYIESNAKLTAKSKAVWAESANAGRVRKFEGDKEVSFETGFISWNLENVSNFLTGSDYTEANGIKTFTYANSDSAPTVFLRFIYTDEVEKIKVTIDMFKCQFNGDLALDFNKKNPVTFDYAFELLAKNNGTKNVYFNIKEETIA